MPFCDGCGGEVEAPTKFCPHCGTSMNSPPLSQSANMLLQDSVIRGNVNIDQSTTVRNVQLTQVIHQGPDPELINQSKGQIESLNVNISAIEKKLDKSNSLLIKDDRIKREIEAIVHDIMIREQTLGSRVLDADTYSDLSTLAMGARADGASYVLDGLEELSSDRNTKIKILRGKLWSIWWICNTARWRLPEAAKLMIDADRLILETLDHLAPQSLRYQKGWVYLRSNGAQKFIDKGKMKLAKGSTRYLDYEQKSQQDPSIPSWMEIEKYLIKFNPDKEKWGNNGGSFYLINLFFGKKNHSFMIHLQPNFHLFPQWGFTDRWFRMFSPRNEDMLLNYLANRAPIQPWSRHY